MNINQGDTMQEIHIKNDNGQPKAIVHRTEIYDTKAQLALDLISKFGMAAIPEGETSSGETKLRVLTAEEVITRCFDVADKAIDEIRKRSWYSTCPSWEEMESLIKK